MYKYWNVNRACYRLEKKLGQTCWMQQLEASVLDLKMFLFYLNKKVTCIVWISGLLQLQKNKQTPLFSWWLVSSTAVSGPPLSRCCIVSLNQQLVPAFVLYGPSEVKLSSLSLYLFRCRLVLRGISTHKLLLVWYHAVWTTLCILRPIIWPW